MPLLGGLLGGGGSTQPLPPNNNPPPPPAQQPSGSTGTTGRGSTGTTGSDSGNGGATGGTSGSTGSASAGGTTTTTGPEAQSGPARTDGAAPTRTPSGPIAVPPRTGTPVDAPAVRIDFTLATAESDEASVRTYAVTAQARERLDTLAATLAEAPKTPTIAVVEQDRADAEAAGKAKPAEPARTEAPSFADNLKTLRGTAEPVGSILDRAA